jgi:Fe-S cluster biogenesis protein NfuA
MAAVALEPTVPTQTATGVAAQSIAPPPKSPQQQRFRFTTERVEKLAAKLEKANDPETRAAALELVQSVVELHAAALEALVERCVATPQGEQALRDALDDDLVASVFLLHSLHPDDMETRVLRGLDKVRPYLKSHGGDCEVLGVRDGIVRLQLHGTCGSCPSSSLTLKTAVEEALFEAAPDIKEIIAENAAGATVSEVHLPSAMPLNPNLVVLQ